MLPAEGAVNITLNFDTGEGINETDEPGSYLLKPKIKMIVNNDTGIIEGEFEEVADLNKIVVFPYSSNAYPKAESFNPDFQKKE